MYDFYDSSIYYTFINYPSSNFWDITATPIEQQNGEEDD